MTAVAISEPMAYGVGIRVDALTQAGSGLWSGMACKAPPSSDGPLVACP